MFAARLNLGGSGGNLPWLRFHESRTNLDFVRERLVDRAFVGDLHQTLSRLFRQIAFDRDFAVDFINPAFAGFAIGAILGVHLAMR